MWYKDGKVFNSQQAIKNELKDVSLPSFLTDASIIDLGFVKVTETVKPIITDVQYVVDGGVEVLQSGEVITVWNIVDMFSDIIVDDVVVSTKAEQEAQYLTAKLNVEKENKIQSIKDTTCLKDPVEINGVTYNGGEASASAIVGAVNLVNLNLETTVQLWDINNNIAVYSITDAMNIARIIALAYRATALARQTRIMNVNAITIDPNGLYPNYESAIAALNLI